MFQPYQLVWSYVETLANLKCDNFDAVGNARSGIARCLNASDHNSAVWQINPLDQAHAVEAGLGTISEIFRLVLDLPERVAPRAFKKIEIIVLPVYYFPENRICDLGFIVFALKLLSLKSF